MTGNRRPARFRGSLTLLIAAGAAALSGCSMPRPVASVSEVEKAGEAGQIVLVPVTAQTVPPPPPAATGFPAEFVNSPEPEVGRLGPGDRLSVNIWESGNPTVFTSTGGGAALGEMTVDESGRVYLPYAGAVQAAGLTVPELRSAIERRLRTVVLNPQVDIRILEQRSALVSVQGDASKTGSFAIERGRTRLGQLLAEVAPSQDNPEMLKVIVRRDGNVGAVHLSDVYSDPSLDIPLQPGDSIIVQDVVASVTVLGAAGVQGQVPITKRQFTLVDALGAARGLDPEAANPRGVFLMRLGSDPNAPPVVYQFDMRRPDSVALAARTVLTDDDAILVSSSPFAQVRLVLASFAQSLGAVRAVSPVP